MKSLFLIVLTSFALFTSCTTSGEPTVFEPDIGSISGGGSKPENPSTSSDSITVSVEPSGRDSSFNRIKIDAMTLTRGGIEYFASAFEISETEVTQKLYADIMGDVPQQENEGDNYPIENISWYDAVLFCNAYSKKLNLDTVYTYTSIGQENYLNDLEIDYSKKGIRLPTELEWEIAARAGSGDLYYWGSLKAVDYAYYNRETGPFEVATLAPNDYGLFDVSGNVAEWLNDWYDAYPTKDVEDYRGADTGTLRCIRGGSWASKADDLKLNTRDKKDPLYASHMVGFRIARTR